MVKFPSLKLAIELLLLSSPLIYGANNDTNHNMEEMCLSASKVLNGTIELQEDFDSMLSSFSEERKFQEDPVEVETFYLYDKARGGSYDRMLNTCENEFNYNMCFVTSQTNFLNEINDVPVRSIITEWKKPICMPKTCDDSQASLLDPNPANCFSDRMNCTLESYEITCPETREVMNDTSTCQDDSIPPISPYNLNFGILEGSILSACGAVAAGGTSDSCSINYGTFAIDTIKDFVDRKDIPEYNAYEENCLFSGGQICDADIDAEYTIPNGVAGTILLNKQYIQFPFCLPVECSSESDLETLILKKFRSVDDDVFNDFLVGDCEVGENCAFNVKQINCHGGMPSTSPTQAPSHKASDAPSIEVDDSEETPSAITSDSSSASSRLFHNTGSIVLAILFSSYLVFYQ